MVKVEALKTFSMVGRGSIQKGTTLFVSSSEELEVLVMDPKHFQNLLTEGAIKLIKDKEVKDGNIDVQS